jgi:hypothetical protein
VGIGGAAEKTLMRFRITGDWQLGDAVAPKGTIIDLAKSDRWSKLAKGEKIPLTAVCLDQESWEQQQREYPDAAHLLGGAWR